MRRKISVGVLLLTLLCGAVFAARELPALHLGKLADGSFFVSSYQRVNPGAIAFDGRPVDLALHPSGKTVAVLGQNRVFLANQNGVIEGSSVALGSGAAYRGICWSPDGSHLYASAEEGYVQVFDATETTLMATKRITFLPEGTKGNPRPGGMCLTRDGKTLFVALCDRNAVAQVDTTNNKVVRELKVQQLPFEVKLTDDEQTLIVSNWGGREPRIGDTTSQSADALIVVDPRGAPSTGTVSIVHLAAKQATTITVNVNVGLHPTGLAVRGNTAYVANAASDTVSVLDIAQARVVRTIPLQWNKMNLFGAMPCALALSKDGKTLYACNGGDNALCEIDIDKNDKNKVRGFRPVGYFPLAVALAPNGETAFVLNTKGNGSVRRTVKGQIGNAHDFQGTVSVVDLRSDLAEATKMVAANNGWNRDRADLTPNKVVYRGAIQHVLYIIKENRTYDEVFGDLPQGNGDPKLCGLGRAITPNHHALAEQFTLFDNGYVSGTNSADGHAWSNQAIASDYLEHFYTGYRTYPDDGDCAMSIPPSSDLWDAAAKKGKSIRVYGEFCDDALAEFIPKPKDWLEVWKDRQSGEHKIKTRVHTRVASLKPYIHPEVVYWPLLQSDQQRADLFIDEYQKNSRADTVPNLMVLSLPCDHTEGLDPHYPRPKSMIADNDLALGRVVEAISHSPQWRNTAIFVIEDDAQSGPDHVDGHRTVFMAFSPYIRRKFVDSRLYTTVSLLRSIELMLGLDPMTRFDALTPPLSDCLTDTPDLSPYTVQPTKIALDDMNPPPTALTGQDRYWAEQSLALDWSGLDHADSAILNRVLWYSFHGAGKPYPGAPVRLPSLTQVVQSRRNSIAVRQRRVRDND